MEKWQEINFEGWTHSDMYKLQEFLNNNLGEVETNLEQKLTEHLRKTTDAYDILLGKICSDNPPAGIAAMAGAVTKVISDIVSLRTEIRTAEAFDELVSAIITVLEDMDTEESHTALKLLRERLKGAI